MKPVYVVETVRTAIGKMGGTIKDVPSDFLGAKVIEEIVTRTNIDKSAVNEVILGQTKQRADHQILLVWLRCEQDFRLKYQDTRFIDNVVHPFKRLIMGHCKSFAESKFWLQVVLNL